MQIGLYFGSFNPIHIGHLIIANHVLHHCAVDRIWFVVSPHNPLKDAKTLLSEQHRLQMVRLAIEDESKFKASNIEFGLPKPSYTIDTLTYLSEKYPQHTFTVIMGGDSYHNLPKWKNYEQLLAQYQIVVFNRPGFTPEPTHKNVTVTQAPLLDISSTFIRQLIKQKKSIRYLVTEPVQEYILSGKLYQ